MSVEPVDDLAEALGLALLGMFAECRSAGCARRPARWLDHVDPDARSVMVHPVCLRHLDAAETHWGCRDLGCDPAKVTRSGAVPDLAALLIGLVLDEGWSVLVPLAEDWSAFQRMALP